LGNVQFVWFDCGLQPLCKKNTQTALGLTALGTSELLNGISNLLVIMALPFSFLYVCIIFLFFKNIIVNKEGQNNRTKH
jgi:glycine betaine transporter